MKTRKSVIATAVVATALLVLAQAPAANAWELVTTTFTASYYKNNVKAGSLTASGYACKVSVPKQGYKVKAYLKVTKSTVPSPAYTPVWAKITSLGYSARGAAVAASVGKTSTTPYINQYLSGADTVLFSIISDELRTDGTVAVKVSDLNFC